MKGTARPNILFVMADDHAAQAMSCYGSRINRTPNMDRLVNEGVSFVQAHIPSGTVGAICMPSRAMLHTGRTLFHLQDAGAVIPRDHRLLGETLQESGYASFGTGKWHNGPASYQRSFAEGAAENAD